MSKSKAANLEFGNKEHSLISSSSHLMSGMTVLPRKAQTCPQIFLHTFTSCSLRHIKADKLSFSKQINLIILIIPPLKKYILLLLIPCQKHARRGKTSLAHELETERSRTLLPFWGLLAQGRHARLKKND